MYGRCAFLCTHTQRPEEVTGCLTLSFSETSLTEPKRVASKPQRSPLYSPTDLKLLIRMSTPNFFFSKIGFCCVIAVAVLKLTL